MNLSEELKPKFFKALGAMEEMGIDPDTATTFLALAYSYAEAAEVFSEIKSQSEKMGRYSDFCQASIKKAVTELFKIAMKSNMEERRAVSMTVGNLMTEAALNSIIYTGDASAARKIVDSVMSISFDSAVQIYDQSIDAVKEVMSELEKKENGSSVH